MIPSRDDSIHVRIGTWNLDRSGVRKKDRAPRQIELMQRMNVDLWVLTETHTAITIPGFQSVASSTDPSFHLEGESCAAIWSRYPLKLIETVDPLSTVCVEVKSPLCPMLVYGTIITYGADGVRDGVARPWERHRQAVKEQTAEWRHLMERYPNHLRCVAGDFNMNLDGARWYGVKDAKEALIRGLDAADMYCATKENLQHQPYNLSRSTIDQICLSNNFALETHLEAWEGGCLSDHNGVLVDIVKSEVQRRIP